jgi:glycolate oxidase iron-sulfur subunit
MAPGSTVDSEHLGAQGAFDTDHPPSLDIVDQCVHCGFCLQACPTYLLWGQESDSPRGRIDLIKGASEGALAITPSWVQHFETCLGCMSCMSACPSGVNYGQLLEATRAQIERQHHRAALDRLHRWLLFNLFPHPERLHALSSLLWLYQHAGLDTAMRRSGVLQRLPGRLRALADLAPRVTRHASVEPLIPAQGSRRARVGLMLGCVQREFLSEVNAATARVLAAEGCEVVAPPDQPCCGALLVHAGAEPPALDLARRTIDVFETADVDCIITNAGGCGSNVKEYGHLLRDDPAYAKRAAHFASRCRDVTEFLAELGPRAERHPLPMRIAYHDSCHLQHAQGVRTQPRALLAAIPQLDVVDVPEDQMCCGSAGIYNLVQPATANELADRKASHIIPLRVQAVATGNPGCLLQLRAALARRGHQMPLYHTIQLVDASIRDVPLPRAI